jgi:16S rRNA (guanine966-N2)-methyltransferase
VRIVAGRFGGRSLAAPPDERIRPTSDRVRGAIFNILAHSIPAFSIEGARVIDLFAGTGALGLEAMSRGAASCLFIEEDWVARGLIRGNVEALGLTGTTRIYRRDATRLGAAGRRETFDLALLDPPYGKGLGIKAVAALVDGGWLAADAVVVLEERADVDVTLPPALSLIEARSWGDTQAVFARKARRAAEPSA